MAIELTAEDRLSDICCIYSASDAIIQCIFDVCNTTKDKVDVDRVLSLVMGLERLNDEIGRHAGAI